MELFKIKFSAYQCYRLGTGGNANLSYEEAQRKLTRNIGLAKPEQIDKNTIKYHYGNLKITVDVHSRTIIKVKNTYTKPKNWGKNQKKFKKLNTRLDIKEVS